MSTTANTSIRRAPPQPDSWVVIPSESPEQQRIRASVRARWEARVKHYTTPCERPLAEPPILDWEQFSRIHVYSNLRYEKLFPDETEEEKDARSKRKGRSKSRSRDGGGKSKTEVNKEKRARMKDLKGESAALFEYLWAVRFLLEDEELDQGRRGFYEGLVGEIEGDWETVDNERKELLGTATGLGRFEYKFLTNKGKLTQIKEWLRKGADIFEGYGPDAEKKYGYLKKEGWKEDPDKTFEAHEFDPDGTLATLQWEIQKQPAERLIIWEALPEAHRHIRYTKVEKKTMWFIPNERPLAEPPNIFYRDPAYLDKSYIQFPEEYHDIAPDDPERKARLKDLEAEQIALGMYFPWAMEIRTEAPINRKNFYQNLSETLGEQFEMELGEECQAFWEEQAELAEKKIVKNAEDAEKEAVRAEERRFRRVEKERVLAEEKAAEEAKKWQNVAKRGLWSALDFADRTARLRY